MCHQFLVFLMQPSESPEEPESVTAIVPAVPFSTKQLYVEHRQYQHSIKGVQFGIMTGESLSQYASAEVHHGHLYDGTGQPVPFGCNDPRMGVNVRGGLCGTCGEPHETCPGHFGFVQLELPVFHVGYFRHTQQVLQSICKACSRVLLTGELAQVWVKKVRSARLRKDPLLSKGLFRKIVDLCKKVRICPHCSAYNGIIKKGMRGPLSLMHEIPLSHNEDMLREEEGGGSRTRDAKNYNSEIALHIHKSQEDLNPLVAYQLLRNVPRFDAEILDVENPEKLIVTNVPVPPVCIRPSVKMGNGYNQEDDITIEVRNLASLNAEIKKALDSGDPLKHVIERWYNLQGHVAMIINSDVSSVAAAYPRDKSVRSICTRLKGKEGRFRGNLSGKRVNFTGRTVISPDPNIEVFEVVVPEFIARRLTFPEAVNDHNIESLREKIVRGNNQHPGAAFIRFSDGSYKYLSSVGVTLRREWAKALRPGDTVERHLVDGDVVLFNRQPSLHKMSIMAHRAKVMPSRTLRFNECVCQPYNADFDGDEMNLHLPQTLEAKAEALTLMGVQMNLITPKSGEPLVAATQDFLTAAFLLTQRDTFLTREDFCQAVSHCTRGTEHIDIPPPAILKPMELWTGKQVFSTLLRPNRNCRVLVNLEMREKNFSGSQKTRKEDSFCGSDGYVLFSNSELLCGNLGKKVLGGSKPGLFFVIIRDASPAAAALAMGRVARLAARWLMNRGMTIGIDDVTPSAEISEFKRNVTQVKYELVAEKIQEFAEGRLQSKPGCTAEQTLEAIINGELGLIRNIIGDKCEAELPRLNKPRLMAICGSKGSAINLSQMMLVLGQQNVNGQRIQDGFVRRTLPHFPKGSLAPKARGFVESSFCSGLQPWEFFFHTMGGREGLVDTAVKTAETGYMQRKLMKALEDLSLKYDDTVRNSSQGIVQFIFGDDGLSPALMEGSVKPLNFPHTFNHIRHVFPLVDADIIQTGAVMRTKFNQQIDERAEGLVAAEEFVIDLKEFLGHKAELLDQLRPATSEGLRYMYDATEAGVTDTQLFEFIKICFSKYRKAKTEPGEAVGAVAAQSIGEPATQMTLKTFHFAGVASMNVTLGVPRIKEIINAAKTISTPIITAALVNDRSEPSARVVAGRIERTTIGDIAKYIKVVYDPRDVFVLIKFDLAAINSAQLELSLASIRDEIVAKGALPARLKMKADSIEIRGKDKILIRPSNVTTSESLWFDLQLIKAHLAAVPVRGVKQAKRVVINKAQVKGSSHGKAEDEFSLLVEGYGLQEVMNTLGVHGEQTVGNHVAEVQAVLGIEAARQIIVGEVLKIMKHHGIGVDNRHVQLLGDCMTNTGDVLGINRFGISKMRQSTLMLASFEKTSDHLFDAAVHNRLDSVEGVSESIIMGNPVQLGTGLFKLLYSIPEEEIQTHVDDEVRKPFLVDIIEPLLMDDTNSKRKRQV